MNKADLADPDITAQWLAYFKSAGAGCLPMNSKQSGKAGAVKGPIEKELSALMERRRKKGMIGARIRVMVVGIPNVGKSTFINSFAGAARAKAANKPGVTRGKQWITVDDYDLMDMPGVLWKKFDSLETASLLQHLGHCNDHIVRARTDLIGAEVQSLFAHIGQTVHSLCLNGRSCLTGSCSAGGGRAAAGCQSTSRCHSTRNLQKAATRNLFHNLVLLFSWGSRVANRTVYFMPSSAASPLFTVFVRFCCLNYIQNGRPLQRPNRLVSVSF
jgi:hypothetical protein